MFSPIVLLRCRIPSSGRRCSFAKRFRSTSVEGAAPSKVADAETASKNVKSAADRVPILFSLSAAFAGVTTVSMAAMAVEHYTAEAVPPFDPTKQRFDESTFQGRFCRMLLACDPALLLHNEQQVRRVKAVLDNWQQYAGVEGMDRVLWESRRIVEGALSHDGSWIPRPFRMSGYVPYNGPICVAMVASTSTPALLFWSWVNQSQNALINYYNKSPGSIMTNETLMKSYAAAVTAALTVAFGLATFIQKRHPPEKARQLMKYVAFPSAITASSLNCYIVRSPEIETGIPLLSEQGRDVLPGSTSQVAAARGVYTTTASRAILQAPVYFVPPVLLSLGPIRRFLTTYPVCTVPVTTFLLLVSFGVGLPFAVAIFPQISEIRAADVEERFHHLTDPVTQKPYKVFYYNKGL